jgi:hypothetical protein
VSSTLPKRVSKSACEFTIVGTTGPSLNGPIKAAPISATPCCKNDRSFSQVKTPGDTIFSAILFLY